MKQAGYTVAQVETDLRLSLIQALMKARWEFFITKREGSLANAITVEAERAAIGYWRVCRIVAFTFRWQCTRQFRFSSHGKSPCRAGLPADRGAVAGKFVELSRSAGMRQTELLKSISARLVEALSSIKPLKAMASESVLTHMLESDARSMNRARQKEILSHESRYALYEPILAVLLGIGLYAALALWKADLETVILLALLFWRAMTRVNGIQNEYQDLARVESAFWSLNEAISQAASEAELTTGGKRATFGDAIISDMCHSVMGSAQSLTIFP